MCKCSGWRCNCTSSKGNHKGSKVRQDMNRKGSWQHVECLTASKEDLNQELTDLKRDLWSWFHCLRSAVISNHQFATNENKSTSGFSQLLLLLIWGVWNLQYNPVSCCQEWLPIFSRINMLTDAGTLFKVYAEWLSLFNLLFPTDLYRIVYVFVDMIWNFSMVQLLFSVLFNSVNM